MSDNHCVVVLPGPSAASFAWTAVAFYAPHGAVRKGVGIAGPVIGKRMTEDDVLREVQRLVAAGEYRDSMLGVPGARLTGPGTGACQIVDEAFNTRSAKPEECVGLERVAVWDPVHVEERLRDHYAGRPNAHLAHIKVRLPPGG